MRVYILLYTYVGHAPSKVLGLFKSIESAERAMMLEIEANLKWENLANNEPPESTKYVKRTADQFSITEGNIT